MATKVEFHSSLTSITNLAELSDMTNKATSPRMHTSPLSNANNKAGDPSNSSNPLGEPNKSGINFKPMTLVSELKPRLSPKPFSKESSFDFMGIRKPLMTPKPQSLMKSSLQENPVEQEQAFNELRGSASISQKNNGSENHSRTRIMQVASKNTFFSKPEPDKPLETASITRSKSLRDNEGRKSDLKPTSSFHTKEWKMHNKFEVLLKPSPISKNTEELHSKESLGCLKSIHVSVDSKLTDDKKEKPILFKKNAASEVQTSAEVQPRRRRRPVSELFLGLPEDEKKDNFKSKDVQSPLSPVKSALIRKPRPLSIDASLKYESILYSQFVPVLSENQEPIHVFTSEICSAGKATQIVPKRENAFCGSVKSPEVVKLGKTNSKTNGQDEELKLTKSSLEEFDQNNSPTPNLTKNRNYVLHHKRKSDDIKNEQEVKMALTDPAFEKLKDKKFGEDNVSKQTFLEKEKHVYLADCENAAENLKNKGNIIPGGTVRNRIDLLFSVNNSPSAAPELQSVENEGSGATIQQRIKELAIENSDVMNVNARQTLAARPLSADLTKLFLGRGSGNERTFEISLEKKCTHSEDVQPVKVGHAPNNQKNEDNQANLDSSSLERISGQRQTFATVEDEKQLTKRRNVYGQRRSFSFRGKHTLSPSNSFEEPIKHTISSESDGLKTVRATLFDHKVERHNAADARSVTDTVFMTTSSVPIKQPEIWNVSGYERRAEIKKDLKAKMHLREEYYRQCDASVIGHELLTYEKNVPFNVEKKTLTLDVLDNRTFDPYDKTPNYEENTDPQRVEPRYEIVQTVGERVVSESISVADKDKAVTLRSRNSSVKKTSIKTDISIPSQDMPLRFGNTSQKFKVDSPTFEATNILEHAKGNHCFVGHQSSRNYEPKDSMALLLLSERKLEKTSDMERYKPHVVARNEGIYRSDNREKTLNNEASPFASKPNRESSTVLESSFLTNVDKTLEVVEVSQEKFNDELDIKSTKFNSQQSLISGYETNYSNDFITDEHHRTELITMPKGESTVFGLKQYQDSGKINKDVNVNVLTKDYFEGNSQNLTMKEKFRKHTDPIPDLKMSERWRRKSAPQKVLDPITEPESALHSANRKNESDLLFSPKAGTTNIKKIKPLMEPNVESQTVSSSENNSKNSLDAVSTCYAVADQVRDFRNESSSGNHQRGTCKVGLGLEEPFSGVSESCTAIRKSAPANSATVLKLHYNNDVSSGRYLTEKLRKEKNKELSGCSVHGMPNRKTNLDDDSHWRGACIKSTENMKENVNDGDLSVKERKENPSISTEQNIAQYSDTYRHSVQNNTPNVVQKDPPRNRDYVSKVEPADIYRSSVLDIDAIMADYLPGYSKVNEILEKQSELLKEQNTPQKEKLKSIHFKTDTPVRNSKDQVETLAGPSFKSPAHTDRHVKIDMLVPKINPAVDSSVADFDVAQRYRGTQLDTSAWYKQLGSGRFSSSHMESRGKAVRELSNKEWDGNKRPCADNVHENPVSDKSDPNWDCAIPIEATDKVQGSKLTCDKGLDGNKHIHVDRGSLVNDKESLMALKHDLIKFKNSLSEYSSDLNQSPADYKNRAKIRDSAAQRENERRTEQRKIRHSLPLEYTENPAEKRPSFRHIRASSDLHKDTDKEHAGRSHRRLDSKDVTHITNHKRSRSLHREREQDLQSVGSGFYDQLKQCFSRPTPAQKDTDTLVQEADSQYGTWSGERQSQDSFSHGSPLSENVSSTRKQRVSSSSSHLELDSQDATPNQRTGSLDRSSVDMDSIDGTVLPPSVRSCPEEGELDFSFPDQTSVLDSSALKNRVQLSRRTQRRAPTVHTQRKSKLRLSDSQFAVIEESDSTWMFKDTTDEKPEKEEESEDEKEKSPKSIGQPQRLPVFPGMDPSVLKAQLRKRPESDGHTEASGSAHVYKSPKSSVQQGAFSGRPLPSAAEKEERTVEMSPQWLQELKSKKRLSQYENSS